MKTQRNSRLGSDGDRDDNSVGVESMRRGISEQG